MPPSSPMVRVAVPGPPVTIARRPSRLHVGLRLAGDYVAHEGAQVGCGQILDRAMPAERLDVAPDPPPGDRQGGLPLRPALARDDEPAPRLLEIVVAERGNRDGRP